MAKHKLVFCLKLYKIMLLDVHTDVVVFTESKWRKGIFFKVCSCECGGNALRSCSFFFLLSINVTSLQTLQGENVSNKQRPFKGLERRMLNIAVHPHYILISAVLRRNRNLLF